MFNTVKKLENGQRVQIICTGDSITEQNKQTHGRLNYVGQLSVKIIDTYGKKAFVFNTGIGGDTSSGLLHRYDRDVLRFKPDMVTVMIGTNDSKFGIEGMECFKGNIEEIIHKTKASGAELVLLTQNPLNYELAINLGRKDYPKYVEILRECAEKNNIPLCDIYRKWNECVENNDNKKIEMMNDRIHPNEYGHDFIAHSLFEFLGLQGGSK